MDEEQVELIQEVLEEFAEDLEIDDDDDFDAVAYIDDVINVLTDIALANALERFPFTFDIQCVEDIVRQELNQRVVNSLVDSVNTWRRAITTLYKIERFLETFVSQLEQRYDREQDPTLLRTVNQLVELSFCGRCTQNIPPLCLNICGAITLAAYSPFYDELQSQFTMLWNTVQRDLEIISETTAVFFRGIQSIIDIDTLVSHDVKFALVI